MQQQDGRAKSPLVVATMSPALKRICYFRMDPQTEIRLSQVDGDLCTHIIMAFARLDSHGNLVVASESDRTYLAEVRDFKRKFGHVKVMISVFNEQEFNGFPKVASSSELRQRFARSAIQFLKQYNLDGVDLDWEFPNFPTSVLFSRDYERTGLTKIISALRSAFVETFFDRQVAEQQQQQHEASLTAKTTSTTLTSHHGSSSSSDVEPYLLTVAIAAQEAILKVSYELKQLSNLCDWLNVMSYDYYLFKPYAPFTGPNSPLHPIVDRYVPVLSKLSFSWSVARLLEEGIERDKIVMGIPTYARAYRLMFKSSQAAPFTLAIGSKLTNGQRIPDYLDYREVCELLAKPGTIVEFDERARVPYLLADNGYTWISFENPQSVREKVRHIVENKLAGYMTWNLNSDHFTGCTKEATPNGHDNRQSAVDTAAFPLHRAMLDELIDLEQKEFSSNGRHS